MESKGTIAEVFFRLRPSPDGYPVPPSRLIYQVVGHGSQRDYFYAGRTVFLDLVEQLNSVGAVVENFGSILDFGCGCGRLIRHWPSLTNAKLCGCDYNRELVKWCAENLKCAEFSTNDLKPGLPYSGGTIDFLYAISVFTHLSPSIQKDWFVEIRRVLSDKGIVLFTTHGHKFKGHLSGELFEQYNKGNCVILEKGLEGGNEYGSFFSRAYVESNVLPLGFRLIKHVPGRDNEDLLQDIYILGKE
ncbi:MAG: methyltransferase domain-containing protein [Chitinivibrionales bacterium]|nr:methyltransferase domain-containing protein [Chitinivibrionales bacterium]MBD3358275.1 methyltransferase domain-containing protein [Chitinivibrionales bacterium]